jgi:hypothetical protein
MAAGALLVRAQKARAACARQGRKAHGRRRLGGSRGALVGHRSENDLRRRRCIGKQVQLELVKVGALPRAAVPMARVARGGWMRRKTRVHPSSQGNHQSDAGEGALTVISG